MKPSQITSLLKQVFLKNKYPRAPTAISIANSIHILVTYYFTLHFMCNSGD
ncbi:hypothetical protein VIBNISFn118_590030 [Vibrio nigripulchritudo SFn118]|nr:hypothetical protein VIBNISFn118_590030 [Vibrio nigripulchritudo SFn118]